MKNFILLAVSSILLVDLFPTHFGHNVDLSRAINLNGVSFNNVDTSLLGAAQVRQSASRGRGLGEKPKKKAEKKEEEPKKPNENKLKQPVDGARDGPAPAADGARDGPAPAADGARDGPAPAADGARDGPAPAADGARDGPAPAADGARDGPAPAADGARDGPAPAADGARDGPAPPADGARDGPAPPAADGARDGPAPPAADGARDGPAPPAGQGGGNAAGQAQGGGNAGNKKAGDAAGNAGAAKGQGQNNEGANVPNEKVVNDYLQKIRSTVTTEWTPCSVTCGNGVRLRRKAHAEKKKPEDLTMDDLDVEVCAMDKCAGIFNFVSNSLGLVILLVLALFN
ncbi:Circumsporozoite protein [Plasmodium coatneyi]|uniref:Circumsporozoite protein n=1 Tax=Plasmodium coatneyi TaxID=208452 RepID=F2VIM1_9APIC|nr:Circumsporozoite protein [Plasmodium coatneyi]ADN94531.1 circumsporozoite protein [Plasmodium coatneyi]AFD97202.1 circumsporozoite protein [Plasmodium coatneyi]ANQ07768.1 Circumsporozoite protein [Plasmodium coatneyi]